MRVKLEVTNGISSALRVEKAWIDVGTDTLEDLKFVDDRTLIIACATECEMWSPMLSKIFNGLLDTSSILSPSEYQISRAY